MAQFEKKYPFTDQHTAYAALRIAQGATAKEIYDELTDAVPGRPDDVPKYEGTYGAARKTISRLTKGQGANVAKVTRAKQAKSAAKKKQTNVSTLEGQLSFLRDIVEGSDARPDAKLKALDMLREIQSSLPTESGDGTTTLSEIEQRHRLMPIELTRPLAMEVAITLFPDLCESDRLDLVVRLAAQLPNQLRVEAWEQLSRLDVQNPREEYENDETESEETDE